MDTVDEPASNGTGWRLRSLEARMSRIEGIEPAVLAERITNHAKELETMSEEIASLRRALYTFALSIAGSAIVFGIAVFQVLG